MNVIFSNNGANQHPDVQSSPGTQMLLTAEGQWVPYTPPQEEPPATQPVAPTEPSTEALSPEPTPEADAPIWPVLAIVGAVCLVGAVIFFVLRKKKA